MSAAKPETVFVCTCADPSHASHYVEELRRAGFRDDEVGIITPDTHSAANRTETAAVTGAVTGGTVGLLAGLALAAGLIPGIGPVLAGGLLSGALAGAVVGAGAGGLLASLIALGVSKDEAEEHLEQLRSGRTMVVVQAPGRLVEASAI